jgi:hypothetical protein
MIGSSDIFVHKNAKLYTPLSNHKRGDRRARQNKSSGQGSTLKQLMADSKESASVVRVRDDVTAKPKNWLLTETVPRNYLSMPFWTQQSYLGRYDVAANTAFAEDNFFFMLVNFPSSSTLAACFDQYCIESVVISATPQIDTQGFATMGYLLTALDFDSTVNLGSLTAIQQFSTCLQTELASGQSIQRAVRPTVAPAIYNVGSAGFSAYGVARMWIDSSNTNCPHYGYRSVYSNPAGTNVAFHINYTVTAILGFRNKH